MKICFLAAANSIHSLRWIKYFSEAGHEIHWISLAPPTIEANDLIKKIKFYEIKPSPLSDISGRFAIRHLFAARRQIKKIIDAAKPDLFHVHSAGTYGLLGALSNFHPLILTPWGSDILLASTIRKPLIKYIVKKADLFTCDGENTFQKLVELGADAKKIQLIRFGTDVEKFRPKTANSNRQPVIRIISLRSLEAVYDIETLIKAAAIVIKEFPDVEFIIAGDGSQKEYLMKLTDDLKLTNNNIKFIGRIKGNDLPSLLQSANIYVSTSLSDSGLAASTAEAMASGLPAIVTDNADNKKWVEADKGGFVIPPKNPEILAEKIVYLIKNPETRKSFGGYNRKIIEEKNNYYIEMAKMEKIYEEIIAHN